ncbi:ParA family protein [Haladaptatus sp. YSMS36]|uniref:ParA family protein n=1 Tax=Haladaptatus sp. YSMS36 TaxID=3033384 RepID=UPI0023E76551|nr:ParA family protein [Haladaptatus sp. YSMS36]
MSKNPEAPIYHHPLQNFMAQKISLYSESGGVGKTTISVNLAAALTRRGYEVLAIDFTGQPSGLTSYFGKDDLYSNGAEENLYAGLMNEKTQLKSTIVHGSEFDFIPTNFMLSALGREENHQDRIFYLDRKLNKLLEDDEISYDFVLIDTPASFGYLADNAIIASDKILTPLEFSSRSTSTMQSVTESLDILQSIFKENNKQSRFRNLGIIPSMVRPHTKIFQQTLEELESHGYTFAPVSIKKLEIFKQAWAKNMSIFTFAENVNRTLNKNEQAMLDECYELADFVADDWTPDELFYAHI